MNVDDTPIATTVTSTTNPSTIDNLHFDGFMDSPNQLNCANDQETNIKIQEALFSHKPPLFMVETALPILEGMFPQNIITNKNNNHDTQRGVRGNLCEQAFLTTNTEEWDMNLPQQEQREPFQVPTMASHLFNNSTNSNIETTISYNLPALIEENVDNIVPIENSNVQDGYMASTLECLKRQDLIYDQWVDSQQCSNFFFWDNLSINMDGSSPVGNQDSSMSLGSSALSSSFPSPF